MEKLINLGAILNGGLDFWVLEKMLLQDFLIKFGLEKNDKGLILIGSDMVIL